MGLFTKVKTAKKVMDTVPDLSSPWNWILGIVNIILPGIGTLIGAAICRSNGCTYIVGVLQFILFPLLVGWIWSIVWGVFMIRRSLMKTVVKKGVEMTTK